MNLMLYLLLKLITLDRLMCKYCYKDFHRSQNLINHIYKTDCGTYHPPNTSANYWAVPKKIPCPQPGCNGRYSNKTILETHLSDRHGIHKSTRKLKVQGRQAKGNVCNFKPNRRKKSKSTTKTNKSGNSHISLHYHNHLTYQLRPVFFN